MCVREGRGSTRLARSRRPSEFRSLAGRLGTASLSSVLALLLFLGCGPQVARVPVSNENILRSNQVAGEADVLFARKDYYAALIKYLEAGRLNPNSEYIQNKTGIAYSQLKYYPEATAAFQRSTGLNPKYSYSYNNLGTVYFAAGDKKKAERNFKKAISLNPDVASFHVNLGSLYFEKKKFDKGMAEWKKGMALDPGVLGRSDGISLAAGGSRGSVSERSYLMARLYASMGDAVRAVESLQQALTAGFTNIAAIGSEKDFDPIRGDERFREFMKTAALLNRP